MSDPTPLRRTPLWDEHRRLTRRIVPFAGWEMPVWYSGIAEEHAAVRQAAGLFDIGHMGALEVSGDGAVSFLNRVATNDASGLAVGRAQYSFLLDPTGLPLDDIILYRLGPERFLMVVNAANAAKDWAWLTEANRAGQSTGLRDLQDPASGDDQRLGLALQGPASLEVLCRLRGEDLTDSPLASMRPFSVVEGRLAGIPAVIARTGYTGERVGFELFVHPERVVELWRLLREAGESLGVRPAGLGARDSLRTEAGLPLYGHELAGPHDITPAGAGYAAAVRLDKGDFIGREAYLAREATRTQEVVRFQMDDPGTPAIRPGDLVASRRGDLAGWVTSCALVAGRQMGMAYVDRKLTTPGAPLVVLPLRGAELGSLPAPADLTPGDRVLLSEKATVLPRFRH